MFWGRRRRGWWSDSDSERGYYGQGYYDDSDSEDEDEEEEEVEEGQRADPYWPFSSIGGSNDILVPKGEICKEMSDLLGKVAAQWEMKYSFCDKAAMLPGLPGLGVKGWGDISLPIRKENATEIENRGKQVRDKVWMLTGDQVEVKNPMWVEGVESLCKASAEKLGFKTIALRPVLDKLLLYGEGGQFERQKDVVGGRCVGRLLIQLPSVCTGGDLVVIEDGTQNHSVYKFGKEDGAAQFVPHYVVYTAGAHRAVEKVTSGYCLMLLYSLYLPRGMPSFNRKNPGQLQRLQLAQTIKKLAKGQGGVEFKGENGISNGVDNVGDAKESKILALMLSRSCQRDQIEAKGVEALTGTDLDRYQSLAAANELVPPEEKLKMCIARLHFTSSGYYGGHAQPSACWYSISGRKLGSGNPTSLEWTEKLNFLNPGNETFSQLWEQYDRDGFVSHERFAIVGWATSTNVKSTFNIMGDVAAAEMALADNPVDITKVQKFLRLRTEQQQQAPHVYGYGYRYNHPTPMPLRLCQKLCKAIADSEDMTLVDAFFKTCFSRLKEKREMTSMVVELIRKVSWGAVGGPYLNAIDQHQIQHADRLGLVLALADPLEDNPVARTALTKAALRNAHSALSIHPSGFASSSDVGLLWKHALACENLQVFDDVSKLFMRMDGKLLGPTVKALSALVNSASPAAHQSTLSFLASRRRVWLTGEITEVSKPFTYETPSHDIPGATELSAFLRGPDHSYIIRGFTSIAQARSRVGLLTRRLQASGLTMTAEGRGRNSYVRLVKGGAGFDLRKQKLPEYRTEIVCLNRLISSIATSTATGNKRPREEAPGVIAID